MGSSSAITYSEMPPHGSGIHLLELLHEGAMFRVYKARINSKFVTLKTPCRDDAMLREMLLREYDLSHTLNHQSIVTTLSFNHDTPCGLAIIREYIEGVPLDEFLATQPSHAQCESLFSNILDAVAYLHYRGIRHNDLKPENIIVTPSGVARIIDFGLSVSDDSAYSGCVGGTEGFTAPEIINSATVAGNASDIYSLGALLNYIHGGRRYARVCHRAMHHNPDCRYQHVDELRQAMRRHTLCTAVCRYALVFAVLFAAVSIAIALLPGDDDRGEASVDSATVPPAVEQVDTTCYDAAVATVDRYFDAAHRKISEQEYLEVAFAWRNSYLQLVVDYTSSLKGDERAAAEARYAVWIPMLDSLCRALPALGDLPAAERSELIDAINTMTFTPEL